MHIRYGWCTSTIYPIPYPLYNVNPGIRMKKWLFNPGVSFQWADCNSFADLDSQPEFANQSSHAGTEINNVVNHENINQTRPDPAISIQPCVGFRKHHKPSQIVPNRNASGKHRQSIPKNSSPKWRIPIFDPSKNMLGPARGLQRIPRTQLVVDRYASSCLGLPVSGGFTTWKRQSHGLLSCDNSPHI